MEDLKVFAKRRKYSSLYIYNNHKEKEDISLLTKKHFEVKLMIYDKASKNFDKEEMIGQYQILISELISKKIDEMNQLEFQALTGKIEAIGELLIKNKEFTLKT